MPEAKPQFKERVWGEDNDDVLVGNWRWRFSPPHPSSPNKIVFFDFRHATATTYGVADIVLPKLDGSDFSRNISGAADIVEDSYLEEAVLFPYVETLQSRFDRLCKQWKVEMWRESSLSKITSNRNYLDIIDLGGAVVPLILRELEKTPGPWFVALRRLTKGTETLGKEFAGDFRKIAECWIKWGKENGKI